MKYAKFWCLTVWIAGRQLEPGVVARQFGGAMKAEFGGVAQASELVRRHLLWKLADDYRFRLAPESNFSTCKSHP
ncbi:MAG TPA: hypothetical protein VIK56_04830 [Rhodoferax sp.]